jgi:REP element-mobilizing transposase RayT
MPRRPRVFASGAIYHVYCRTARSVPAFGDDDEAAALARHIADVGARDGVAVLAWCVMPTHYHLAVRTGEAPLWRSMRTVQGRFAQAFNRRHRLIGSLWQERYKCKLIDSSAYLRQLLAYIHLNPVAGGLARAAGDYRWSGHLELLGRRAALELVDADETLALLGSTVRQARRAYRQLIAAASGQEWVGKGPGALPWWRVERDDESDREPQVRPRTDAMGASSGIERPDADAERFLAAAGEALGERAWVIWSRRRVRAEAIERDLVALLAVERYCLRVRDLAARLGRKPDEVSRWATRGALRRQHDTALSAAFRRLDSAVAKILSAGRRRAGGRATPAELCQI